MMPLARIQALAVAVQIQAVAAQIQAVAAQVQALAAQAQAMAVRIMAILPRTQMAKSLMEMQVRRVDRQGTTTATRPTNNQAHSMQFSASRRSLGFGLAEILIAAALSSAIAGVLFTGAITVQRSFFAARHFVRTQAQQMRVLDYVALDARRASNFILTPTGGLDVYLPDFYNTAAPDNPQPRAPQLTSDGIVYYGAPNTTIVVKYYQEGDTIVRESQDTKQVLVNGIEDFKLEFPSDDSAGRTLKATVKVRPKFSRNASATLEEHNTASVVLLLRNRLK